MRFKKAFLSIACIFALVFIAGYTPAVPVEVNAAKTAEELREELKKKVDVLDQKQLENNFQLANEILRDGIKIYG